MGLSKGGFDILQGPDKAETGRGSGDPTMRKLRITLQDGRKKYSGSKETAVQVLAAPTRIGDCLMEVSPTYGEAWNGRMRCTTGTNQATQEHEAMVETAHKRHSAKAASQPWP